MGHRSQYPDEFREEAVRLARLAKAESRPLAHVARELGLNAQTLTNWVHDAQVESGDRAERVRRLMRLAGIQGHVPRLKRRISHVDVDGVHAPDLVRHDWNPSAPNTLWMADITYIRIWQGWLYLAVIMDVCSRRIVGWSMQSHMRTDLVQDALDMAIARRRPVAGRLHHTDHASQYAALTFGVELRKHKIEASMGRVRTCYDNAAAESFFATLKKDLINRYRWADPPGRPACDL